MKFDISAKLFSYTVPLFFDDYLSQIFSNTINIIIAHIYGKLNDKFYTLKIIQVEKTMSVPDMEKE